MAELNHQTTYSSGIYHGLPTFPSITGQTAIITGANGISGQAMLSVLLAHPERWTSIYALSQSPPLPGGATAPHVKHVKVNFLSGKEKIAEVLKKENVKGDFLFFFSYKESTDAEVMVKENGAMLEDFIGGLEVAGVDFKRIVLQTGGKHYGVHQGLYNIPAKEDDPRVDLGPNFYYRQEDILKDLGPKLGFDWCVVRPMTIIGALKGNYLNLAIALGLYLAVTKELKETPIFPGNVIKYHTVEALSSSKMTAYFEEWCALTPIAVNEAFNTSNGDVSVWARLWPDLCHSFNLQTPDAHEQFVTPPPHRLSINFPTVRPYDYKSIDTLELRNSLQLWSKEPRVIEAWNKLAGREGLAKDAFENASWGYADRNLGINYSKIEDLGKVRRMGFLGYVDSAENFWEVFGDAGRMGILPKFGGDS